MKQNKSKPTPDKTKSVSKKKSFFSPENYKIHLVIIVILTAIVFSNSINNGFTNWDDDIYLKDNDHIKTLDAKAVKDIFTTHYFGNYHPLTTLFYAVEYHFFKLDSPWVFHLNNLIFHLLNTVLVFVFIRLLTKRYEVPLIVAMLFALHPMHVESVAWISERKDVLYTFFFLLSLIQYVKHIKSSSSSSGYKPLVLSFVFFTAALLSKSAAVTLPLTALLCVYFIKKKITVRDVLHSLPFFLLSLVFGIIAIKTQEGAIGDLSKMYHGFNRVLIVFYAIYFYIIRFIAPYNFTPLHALPKFDGAMLPLEYYIAPVILILVIVLFFVLKKEWRHLYGFSMLFYLINVLLIIQIISLGQAIVSERYAYVPYIGLSFIGAHAYMYLYDKFNRSWVLILGVLYLIFLGVSSHRLNAIWKDSGTLWTYALDKNPDLEAGLNNLGLHMSETGKNPEAYKLFTRLIEINPEYEDVYNNRATACFKMKDYECVIRDLNISIEQKPYKPKLYNNRGLAKYHLKRFQEAIADFNKAIELDSTYNDAYNNRSNALSEVNDFAGAIKDLNYLIAQNPGNADLYNLRGILYGKAADYSMALKDFEQTILIKPGMTEAYTNKGFALLNLGRIADACSSWQKALELGNQQVSDLLNQFCRK
ncbi:MAG: lipoprotein NlpI [Bacteroidetes bacterium ADurb.Bin408]|nr:MAG: lipoprotein NlpI [Bacteroidetes bacterium ADurb.Bin408]